MHPYQKLPGSDHLRLLEVHDTNGTMSFRLKTLSLDEARDKFVAISYCWGTDPTSRLLPLADGTCIRIRTNVESLIARIFTDCSPGELLWIDAICINQEDVDEKTQQVRIMNEIYRAARRVSVWLGRPDDGDEEEAATHLAHFYFGFVDHVHIAHIPSYENNSDRVNWERGSDGILAAARSWAHLVSLPWFVRVWVIQEVCYGKLVWFHYGRLIVTFAALSDSFSKIQKHLGDGFVGPDGVGRQGFRLFNHYHSIREFLTGRDFSFPEAFSLENIHSRFAFTLATDPRDRVFALLNISDARLHGSCILPDYRSSTWDAFVHAAVAILTHSPRLELLGYAGLANSPSSYSGKQLPSWVPDFASLSSFFPLNLSAEPNRELYCAAPIMSSWAQVATWCQLDEQDIGRWNLYITKCSPGTRHPDYHGLVCPAASPEIPQCPGIIHQHNLTIQGHQVDIITATVIRDLSSPPNSIAMSIPWTASSEDPATIIHCRDLTIKGWILLLEETLEMAKSLMPYPYPYPKEREESVSEILLRTLTVNRFQEGEKTRAPLAGELPDVETLIAGLRKMLEIVKDEEREESGGEEEKGEARLTSYLIHKLSTWKRTSASTGDASTESVSSDAVPPSSNMSSGVGSDSLSTDSVLEPAPNSAPAPESEPEPEPKSEPVHTSVLVPVPPPEQEHEQEQSTVEKQSLPKWDSRFWPALELAYPGTSRRVFRTARGYLGIGRTGLQVGDEIWLLYGASVPFIVRRSETFKGEQPRQLVCDAYVHGIMQGEGMEMRDLEGGLVLLE